MADKLFESGKQAWARLMGWPAFQQSSSPTLRDHDVK